MSSQWLSFPCLVALFTIVSVAVFAVVIIHYTTIGELSAQIFPQKSVLKNLSSKFDAFLTVLSQFDSDHGVDFYAHTCCDLWTAFCVLLSFVFYGGKLNNVAFRPRRVVYAAVFALDVTTALRQINR